MNHNTPDTNTIGGHESDEHCMLAQNGTMHIDYCCFSENYVCEFYAEVSVPPGPCEYDGAIQCQNGGVCVATSETEAMCQCPDNYSGTVCEIANIPRNKFCESDTCNSVGTEQCIDLESTYFCKCNSDYTGDTCSEEPCKINDGVKPCGANGICQVASNERKYRCSCFTGYYGLDCQFSGDTIVSKFCEDLEGGHYSSQLNVCFKEYTNEMKNQDEALQHCLETAGTKLAGKLADGSTVEASYILETHFPNSDSWLGAKSDGSNWSWQTNDGDSIVSVNRTLVEEDCLPKLVNPQSSDECLTTSNIGENCNQEKSFICQYYDGLSTIRPPGKCNNTTCKNNATCLENGDQIFCQCSDQHTGAECEVSSCENITCSGHGNCTANPIDLSHNCTCEQDYWGPHCENHGPTIVETECENITGAVYNEVDDVCYKGFTDENVPWDEAMLKCVQDVPSSRPELKGRLTSVQSSRGWTLLQDNFENDFWIGGRSTDMQDVANPDWVPSDWYWYDNAEPDGQRESFSNVSSIIDDPTDIVQHAGESCARINQNMLRTEFCCFSGNYICEYYTPERIPASSLGVQSTTTTSQTTTAGYIEIPLEGMIMDSDSVYRILPHFKKYECEGECQIAVECAGYSYGGPDGYTCRLHNHYVNSTTTITTTTQQPPTDSPCTLFILDSLNGTIKAEQLIEITSQNQPFVCHDEAELNGRHCNLPHLFEANATHHCNLVYEYPELHTVPKIPDRLVEIAKNFSLKCVDGLISLGNTENEPLLNNLLMLFCSEIDFNEGYCSIDVSTDIMEGPILNHERRAYLWSDISPVYCTRDVDEVSIDMHGIKVVTENQCFVVQNDSYSTDYGDFYSLEITEYTDALATNEFLINPLECRNDQITGYIHIHNLTTRLQELSEANLDIATFETNNSKNGYLVKVSNIKALKCADLLSRPLDPENACEYQVDIFRNKNCNMVLLNKEDGTKFTIDNKDPEVMDCTEDEILGAQICSVKPGEQIDFRLNNCGNPIRKVPYSLIAGGNEHQEYENISFFCNQSFFNDISETTTINVPHAYQDPVMHYCANISSYDDNLGEDLFCSVDSFGSSQKLVGRDIRNGTRLESENNNCYKSWTIQTDRLCFTMGSQETVQQNPDLKYDILTSGNGHRELLFECNYPDTSMYFHTYELGTELLNAFRNDDDFYLLELTNEDGIIVKVDKVNALGCDVPEGDPQSCGENFSIRGL